MLLEQQISVLEWILKGYVTLKAHSVLEQSFLLVNRLVTVLDFETFLTLIYNLYTKLSWPMNTGLFNLLASTPHIGNHSWKWLTNLKW